MKIPVLAVAALLAGWLLTGWLLAGCASLATEPGSPPSTARAPGKTVPVPPKDGTSPAAPPGFAPPAALPDGDRWFVAIRTGTGPEPVAERSRRSRGEGWMKEEVTWGRSFADVAGASHGTAQVFALLLDGRGLCVSLLDEGGRPAGDVRVEVAAPFRSGTAWIVPVPGGNFEARIAGMEPAATPGGDVPAIRVEVLSPGPRPVRMITWYDAGLRPVRAEYRRGSDEVLESRAALASATPSPEECRAAMEWARKNLPAPVVR